MTILNRHSLTPNSNKRRIFVEQSSSLIVDGPLPAGVQEHFPCFDIQLAPKGTLLSHWSIGDAADWMLEWPPRDGELYSPLDVWDEEVATLWLGRHQRSSEFDSPELVDFNQRRSSETALEVLSNLNDDGLLMLTDAVFRERFRREVLPHFLTARAEAIQVVARRVEAGGMTLKAARKILLEHDESREAVLREAFAENDEWISDWIVDFSQHLIDLYVWPTGFFAQDLAGIAWTNGKL